MRQNQMEGTLAVGLLVDDAELAEAIELSRVATSDERCAIYALLASSPRIREVAPASFGEDLARSIGDGEGPVSERCAALQVLRSLDNPKTLSIAHDFLTSSSTAAQVVGATVCLDYGRSQSKGVMKKWFSKRLEGRGARKTTNWIELPIGIMYFDRVGELAWAGEILSRFDSSTADPTEGVWLDAAWPQSDRDSWARGVEAGRPSTGRLISWSRLPVVDPHLVGDVRAFIPQLRRRAARLK